MVTEQPIEPIARATLILAIAAGDQVLVFLRNKTPGTPMRMIEGVPTEIATMHDGRERLVLGIAEGTEQFVLLDRIARVIVRRKT